MDDLAAYRSDWTRRSILRDCYSDPDTEEPSHGPTDAAHHEDSLVQGQKTPAVTISQEQEPQGYLLH